MRIPRPCGQVPTGWVAATAVLLAATAWGASRAEGPAPPRLRVSSLELVNRYGEVRARLSTDDSGRPHLRLLDHRGFAAAEVYVGPNGSRLALTDNTGRNRFTVQMSSSEPCVIVADVRMLQLRSQAEGQSGVVLSADESGGDILVTGPRGERRTLSATHDSLLPVGGAKDR